MTFRSPLNSLSQNCYETRFLIPKVPHLFDKLYSSIPVLIFEHWSEVSLCCEKEPWKVGRNAWGKRTTRWCGRQQTEVEAAVNPLMTPDTVACRGADDGNGREWRRVKRGPRVGNRDDGGEDNSRSSRIPSPVTHYSSDAVPCSGFRRKMSHPLHRTTLAHPHAHYPQWISVLKRSVFSFLWAILTVLSQRCLTTRSTI